MHSHERVAEILRILETTSYDTPTTTKALAQLLKVSKRTIHSDLELVKDLLIAQGRSLQRQAGRGMWLTSINVEAQPMEAMHFPTPKERRDHIIVALLERKLSSIDVLAAELQVSRTTLLHDLKAARNFLKQRGLLYDGKRGLGIGAHGEELALRDALIHVFARPIYDFLHFHKVSSYPKQEKPLRMYAENMPVEEIAHTFIDFAQRNSLHGDDVAMNRMLVALIVQIKRIQSGHQVLGVKENAEKLPLYSITQKLARSMAQFAENFLAVPETEALQKELLHSRFYLASRKQTQQMKSAHTLAREFVASAESWLGYPLLHDGQLLKNLANHLRPAIERARCGIVLSNPMLTKVQENHEGLFQIAYQAAQHTLVPKGILLSEDEIAFLAIHLGAALERQKASVGKKLTALLVCGNGLGIANLLEMTLQNRMPFLTVVDKTSFYKLNPKILASVDLVISTMPLELQGKTTLCIPPILNQKELRAIEHQIQNIYRHKYTPPVILSHQEHKGKRLFELLKTEAIAFHVSVKNWLEAVREAGKVLERLKAAEPRYTEAMVQAVCRLGTYAVLAPGILMPHARVEDGAKRVAICYLHLDHAVLFGKGTKATKIDTLFAFSTTSAEAHVTMLRDLWYLFQQKEAIQRMKAIQEPKRLQIFLQEVLTGGCK